MNPLEDITDEDRWATLLACTGADAAPPDTAFLTRLRTLSTEAFATVPLAQREALPAHEYLAPTLAGRQRNFFLQWFDTISDNESGLSWRWHLALPIFTITIFVSAFLLFLVQPLVGKLILPKLGGTPQVWNTCMVFFQSALLAGYAYTHFVSTKLKLRQQIMLHAAILVIPIIMMWLFPIYLTVHNWNPPTEGNPIPNTLGLLALIVGIPFLVVSTSAPLLQKWFGYSGHSTARDPYFLYSASNAGSLLSLFFYPALIEPFTFLPTQSYVWFVGYVVLAGLILLCAVTIFKLAPSDEQILAAERAAGSPPPAPMEMPEAMAPAPVVDSATAVKSGPAPASPRVIQRKKGMPLPSSVEAQTPGIARGAQADVTWWRRIRWVLLAAVPSSLMLGVTSYISTDLSPFPLVWIIPLTLYLLSFILVYLKVWTRSPIHQAVLYVLHPLGLLVLCFIVLRGGFDPFFATTLVMLGFFASALACHGELAMDRPATKYLTEYFLLMSVGGMVGGIFNGIIAPVVFQTGVLEFYIAIVVACLVRPQYVPTGWLDGVVLQAFPGLQVWARNQGDEMARSMGRPAPHSTYLFSFALDIIFGIFMLALSYWLTVTFSTRASIQSIVRFFNIPSDWGMFALNLIVLGIPMLFCFFFAGRPLRFTLAVAALLVGNMYLASRDNRDNVESRRTYFGLLKVMRDVDAPNDPEERAEFIKKFPEKDGKQYLPNFDYTFLMHGTTYHGRNYIFTDAEKKAGYIKDLTRLATTYYHRYGPVGAVMERDNWFPGKQNTFDADARLPVSLVGQLAASLGSQAIPIPALVECWSEPPFATIGLGTGTMVSYARPYQHMTYYEIDEVIREFSLPDGGREARFTYLQNAIKRGVNLEVIMGDARLSLEHGREEKNLNNSLVYSADFSKKEPEIQAPVHSKTPNREKYYRAIIVDAFSSDAIPIHLCTKEAIALYMSKLTDDGVLCMHTSNRHMDLVRPVARIAMELSKEAQAAGLEPINCIVGKDGADKERYMGHFSSEYVMLYRGDGFRKYVEALEQEKAELINKGKMDDKGNAPDGRQILNSVVKWYDPYKDHDEVRNRRLVKAPVTVRDSLWTDDYSYILGVLR